MDDLAGCEHTHRAGRPDRASTDLCGRAGFPGWHRLGRLATGSPDGVVGNAPVTFFLRADDTVEIGGSRMGGTRTFTVFAARGSKMAVTAG